MVVKIGINGFGRIGRLVLRASCRKVKERCPPAEVPLVVAVNDPFLSAEHMANLLKYDSTHGLFQGDITVLGKALKIEGQMVDCYNEKLPEKIPWGNSCVQYVVDATGLYKTQEKCAGHFKDSVKRVLITAPTKKDVPMFVYGVNQDEYKNDMRVISNASCTTNCLAPLVKVIQDNFEIEGGLMTTIHAITPSQNTLDGPAKKNFRIGRGALQNIIPSSTGAAKAIGRIIPCLDGKLTGFAARVPVANGSMVDLTAIIKNPTEYDVIKAKVKEAADSYMKGILAYTDEQIVSSDIIGDSRSCIFDASAGLQLTKNFVKLIMWYDNEWGYSCRVLDMVRYIASRECDK